MLRRAHENKGILTKLEKEKTLLKLELKVKWKKMIIYIFFLIMDDKRSSFYIKFVAFIFIFLKSSPPLNF